LDRSPVPGRETWPTCSSPPAPPARPPPPAPSPCRASATAMRAASDAASARERASPSFPPWQPPWPTPQPLPASPPAAASTPPRRRPLGNTRASALDERLQPLPAGVPGELFLSAAGVARGYLGSPGLTAECFGPDPYSPVPGERLYRTGDRARWLTDGRLEFL